MRKLARFKKTSEKHQSRFSIAKIQTKTVMKSDRFIVCIYGVLILDIVPCAVSNEWIIGACELGQKFWVTLQISRSSYGRLRNELPENFTNFSFN